jgi:methylmalonyl-CoA mutase C-terminal domain/subunit
MSGAHMTLFPAVIDALKTRGASEILIFGGGIIPDEDVELLHKAGVSAIFKPGASTQEIIDWVETNIRPKHEGA